MKQIQIKRIAAALTNRFNNRHIRSLWGELPDELCSLERQKAEEYWQRMIEEGGIDRFNKQESKSDAEKEKYIDINTIEHTDAREVGAEWLCRQTIDQLDIKK